MNNFLLRRSFPKQFTILFISLLCVLFIQPLHAAWVENMPVKVENPDGTTLELFVTGDEFFNFLHDKDGYTIIQAHNGFFYYAQSSGDTLAPSPWRVGQAMPKTLPLEVRAGISEQEYQRRKDEMFKAVADEPHHHKAAHSGTLNNIVIYIRFADDPEFSTPRSTFDGRLNNNSSPSVKHYFQEVSYGMVTVESHHFPLSDNMSINLSYQDVYPRSYFQPYNATSNPDGYTSSQRAQREHQLLHRAVTAVASQIPPDLDIDNDNDGRVDNVCFIIQGGNGAWASILWAHRWMLYSTQTFIHGKRVWDYTFQPESQATVTILNHELFHTFGAPDLYRYSNNSITPVGPWDLMHSGSGHMGAYMKWKYSNQTWISSIPVISEPGTYTLNPLTSPENNAFRINSPHSSTEYFVVEYRRKQPGTYDNSLPGSGLLIYRINTLAGNGNANGPPDEVYLYRPNGTNSINGVVTNANYSAHTGRTSINDLTNPSSFLSNNGIGGLDISNITEAGETISFDLFGGSTVSHTVTVAASPAHGGTVSGGGTYWQGQNAQVSATVASNFTFQNWTENGNVVSTQPNYSFQVNSSRNLVANFEPQGTIFNIAVSANPSEGGNPTGGGNYQQGHSVTLAANPAASYEFIHWTENGNVVSTQANYSFAATANRQIVAHYQVKTYQISLTANPSNGGNVAGAGTFNHGAVRSVSAFPASGFEFVNWTENGTVVSTNSQYMFQLTANRNLVANFQSTSSSNFTISATANPTQGGTISGTGNFPSGQTATLTATPAAGYSFVNWTENGNVVSSQASYSFTVTGNRTLTANFAINTHTLTLNANPTQGGTTTGAGTFNHGQTATVTATPAAGYSFVNWTENGNVVSSQASYSFTVTGNRTLTANFAINTHTLTLNANPTQGGTTTGAGTFNHGQTATVTATPAAGYSFVNWTENGNVVSNQPYFSFTIEQSHTLIANFAINTHTLTLNANPTQGGTTTGAGTFNHGQTATVTATPAAGYSFVNWTENGNVVSSQASYSFTVTGNRTLTANFAINTHTLTLNANPTQGGTTSGAGSYNHGQTATVTATTAAGYSFVNWTENGNVVSSQASYSFTVTGNRTLTANFAINTHTLTLNANPTQGGTTTGAGTFNHGQTATVTATPAAGYSFVNWTENGNLVSNQPYFSFTVEQSHTLIANFVLQQDEEEPEPEVFVNIQARSLPTGTGFIFGAGEYPEHNTVTLNALPVADNFEFQGWVENGQVVSTDNPYLFAASENRNLTARFRVMPRKFQVEVKTNSSDMLEVIGEGEYEEGEYATLEIITSEDHSFEGWKNPAGQIVSRSNPYTFAVNRNLVLEALIKPRQQVLSITDDEVKVFPNPTSGPLQIDIDHEAILTVRNTAGFAVYQRKIMPGDQHINLDFLPIGMYMLHFQTEEKVISTKVIIK